MISTEEQKRLDKELFRECEGYSDRDIKPDGAYIEENGRFFNVYKINRLIEMGADVNAKDYFGISPLHMAVYMDNVPIAKLLISVGAKVNSKDVDGDSPLAVAVSEDNVALSKLLISAGADVNTVNDEGRSPLAVAVRWGNKEMQSLLKQHGAI